MRYDHFTMLPHRAFRVRGRHLATLEGGGKGDTPDAPDYTAAANATAAGNLQAAKYAVEANRANQYTPQGSLVWSKAAQPDSFNEQAYLAAQQNYRNVRQKWYDNPNAATQAAVTAAKYSKSMFGGSDLDQWESNQTYSPEQQSIYDKQSQLSNSLLNSGINASKYIDDALSNPLTIADLPRGPVDAGQTTQDALLARLAPALAKRREASNTSLANQGIFNGSKAYQSTQDQQGRDENDMYLQAGLQGVNADMAVQNQQFQLLNALQNQPINLVSALRTGSQVSNPSFAAVPQQATTAGADLLGAANAQYGADANAASAKNAAGGSFANGLFSLGAAYLTGGASLPFTSGG